MAETDIIPGSVSPPLATYKVPMSVGFIDDLPRNASGKVLKRELADLTGVATRVRHRDITRAS